MLGSTPLAPSISEAFLLVFSTKYLSMTRTYRMENRSILHLLLQGTFHEKEASEIEGARDVKQSMMLLIFGGESGAFIRYTSVSCQIS